MRGTYGDKLQARLLVDFDMAARFVERMPETIAGSALRCHEVARAVLEVLRAKPLKTTHWAVIDGVYGWSDHSWLVSGGWGAILDVYSVGQWPLCRIVDPYGPEGTSTGRSSSSCLPTSLSGRIASWRSTSTGLPRPSAPTSPCLSAG